MKLSQLAHDIISERRDLGFSRVVGALHKLTDETTDKDQYPKLLVMISRSNYPAVSRAARKCIKMLQGPDPAAPDKIREMMAQFID